ncbi:MAG TPA: hypothetical protein VGC09_05730 [Rhodopila sp.]
MAMISRDGVIAMVDTQSERGIVPCRSAIRPMSAGQYFVYATQAWQRGPGLDPRSQLIERESDDGAFLRQSISEGSHTRESIDRLLRHEYVLPREIHHRLKTYVQIVHSRLGLQSTTITRAPSRRG